MDNKYKDIEELMQFFLELMSKNDYRPLKFKELCYLLDVTGEEEKQSFLEELF